MNVDYNYADFVCGGSDILDICPSFQTNTFGEIFVSGANTNNTDVGKIYGFFKTVSFPPSPWSDYTIQLFKDSSRSIKISEGIIKRAVWVPTNTITCQPYNDDLPLGVQGVLAVFPFSWTEPPRAMMSFELISTRRYEP